MPPSPFRLGFAETVDSTVVWFAVAASAATALAFWTDSRASRHANNHAVPDLKSETPTATVGGRRVELQSLLVVTQNRALAAALIVCTALFGRSLNSARRIDVGFQRADRFVMSFDLSIAGYDAGRGDRFDATSYAGCVSFRVSRRPAWCGPLNGLRGVHYGRVRSREDRDAGSRKRAGLEVAGRSPYFATMGTAIVAGREFTEQDDSNAPPVVIVNETMARRYWPGGDAVGRELRVGGRTGQVRRVVGVVRDGKYVFLGEQPMPAL